jgi:hypothetical protein
MSDLELTLSAAVTMNSITNDVQGEFTFIVDSERFSCPLIVAEFLSRRICNARKVDASITEYLVQTSDVAKQFQSFLSLGEGPTIRVDHGMSPVFVSLCRELNNPELCASLLKHFQTEIRFEPTYAQDDEGFLSFIASQFYKFSTSDLDNIPLQILYHILSQDPLVLVSDDWLCSYILCRLSTDPEYSELLQFVRFEYVSIQYILDLEAINPESIGRPLWETISRRLMLRHPEGTPFPCTSNPSIFEYKVSQGTGTDIAQMIAPPVIRFRHRSFGAPREKPKPKPRSRGIIPYLTREHGGNLHDNGIVTITSKSVHSDDPEHALRNVFDLDSWSTFLSQDEPNQWICFDFHGLWVSPTHYAVRSHSLDSWLVESSVDGVNWVEIDRRTGVDPWVEKSFTVSNSDECHFIRLTQTGPNRPDPGYDIDPPPDDYSLSIGAFDVFGNLRGRHD